MENKNESVFFSLLFGAALFFSLFLAVFFVFNADVLLTSPPVAELHTAGLDVYQAPKKGFFDW